MSARRGRANAKLQQSQLYHAVKFISLVQSEEGTALQTHCTIGAHWVWASNGMLSAGAKIAEDFNALPHTYSLMEALSKCGEEFAIAQIDRDRLSVRAGRFGATIDCVAPYDIQSSGPDAAVAPCDDRLRLALEAVAPLADVSADKAVLASVLLGPGSVRATNGALLMEYWHGIDLPPASVVPKAAVAALLKIDKKIKAVGASTNSITFHFDDDSWFKTQLFQDSWPDTDVLLNIKSNQWPFPDNFFTALEAVESFCTDGHINFDPGMMRSHEKAHNMPLQGAEYQCDGLPGNMAFTCKYLRMIEGHAKTIDLTTHDDRVLWFGENIRGVLMKARR